jgi:hypothetical protein
MMFMKNVGVKCMHVCNILLYVVLVVEIIL